MTLTFCGVQYTNPDEALQRPVNPVDVGILGAPTDYGSETGSGQARAPYRVRLLERPGSMYDPTTGIDYSTAVSLADFGDVYVVPGSQEETMEQVALYMRDVAPLAVTLVVIGGDHSLTAAAIKGLTDQGEKLTLIHVDAHSDTGYHSESTGFYSHSSWVRKVVEDNMVDAVHQYGIRAWGPSERERVQSDMLHLHSGAFAGQLAHCLRTIHHATSPIYLSIDMDVADPSTAPGVLYPEPGGWSARELLDFIVLCASTGKVRCIDLVEVVPDLDVRDLTLRLLHRSVLAVVQGVAQHVVAASANKQRTGESEPDSGSVQKGNALDV